LVPEELLYRALDLLWRRGWHRKIAKYAQAPHTARWQPLLYHAINSALAAHKAAQLLHVPEDQLAPLFAGMLIHDYTKTRQGFQELPSGGGEAPGKTLSPGEEAEARRLLEELGLSGEELELALKVALLNESPGKPVDLVRQFSVGPLPERLRDAAVLGDLLASLKGYWELPGRIGEILGRYGYRLAYHRVSQVRGVVTQIVHRAVARLMEEKGFTPLLYLADGIVYAGKEGAAVSEEELRRAVEEGLRGFLDSMEPEALGQAAFGNIVQTVIRAPELLKASPRAVEGLWGYVGGQRFIRDPSPSDRVMEAVEAAGFSGPGAEDVAAKVVSVKNISIVFKEVLRILEEGREEALSGLAEALGVSRERLEQLLTVGNTTSAEKLVSIILPFLRETGLLHEDHDKLVDRLLRAVEEASRRLRAGGELFRDEISLILGELYIWVDGRSIVPRRPEAVYEKGKDDRVKVCFLCGAPASYGAIASLTGDGAESFHNLRAGGEHTGGQNRAWICPLCRLEAMLRNLLGYDTNRYDVYYVLPAIAMAPGYAGRYWAVLVHALSSGEGGFSLHSPRFWERYLEGINPAEVARNPLRLHEALGDAEAAVSRLAERLKARYGDLAVLRDFGLEASDWREAAEKVLRGEAPPELLEELSAVVSGSDYAAVLSGNYMVVMAIAPGARDEAEASKMLRRLNRALMLYTLFHAFVYVPGEKMSPFPEPRPLGAAKVPLKADLAAMLRARGVVLRDGWVGFEETARLPADELSKALTAAELVVYELSRARAGYGNSGLLGVLSRPPGMILARYASALGAPLAGRNRERSRVFLRYLDVLEERWWM